MDYHANFIIDFAKRTKENLERIESLAADGQKVFEVTQLANSLLGLLVFPREHYMKSIPATPLSDLVKQGWPEIHPTKGSLPQDNLRELMRMLRNSIAHCNVKFSSDDDRTIDGLRIWNTYQGKTTWETKLSIEELRLIAFKFADLIERKNTAGDTN